MKARRKGWSGWAVRLVALLFAVQGAVLAFSQGASADALPRDQFGNVICIAGANMSHGAGKAQSDRHTEMMTCCSLACGMFTGIAVPAPDHDAPLDASAPVRVAAFVSYRSAIAGFIETPRRTRGPPAAV